MIYITSDHHFGHANIIKHCQRPFKSVGAMDEYMINAWNSVVGEDDDVFHLGDISHKKADTDAINEIIQRLNGRKHLIVGNHEIDHGPMDEAENFSQIHHRIQIDDELFESINPGYHEITVDGKLIVMSHYAMQSWHDMRKGSIHLHGHSHGQLTKAPRRLDVGVDTHDFKPWSIDQIRGHFDPQNKRKKKPDQEQLETVF